MKYTQHALNVLTAKSFKGIGNAWVFNNIKKSISEEQIIDLLKHKVKEETVNEEVFSYRKAEIEEKVNKLEGYCDGFVAIGEDKFPSHRGNVKAAECPNVLFYRGDLDLLSQYHFNIAVIGVLTPDVSTQKEEEKIVSLLVEKNAVIVSGLALGCDEIAHRQTIRSNGVTVAVLPSSLNDIQPVKNKELANQIVQTGGLLITEYYQPALNRNEVIKRYIERDRLQALFSDCVLLSSSYKPDSVDRTASKIDSGSRHAMNKAKEYGIQRAVVYHEKYAQNPKYDLNREIMEDGSVIKIDAENPNQNIFKIFTKQLDSMEKQSGASVPIQEGFLF